jgi:hypothetical protein
LNFQTKSKKMNFTQSQISDILSELANERGTDFLLKLTLDAFMKSERTLYQKEHPDEYANGYRYCKAMGRGKSWC